MNLYVVGRKRQLFRSHDQERDRPLRPICWLQRGEVFMQIVDCPKFSMYAFVISSAGIGYVMLHGCEVVEE